MIEYVKGLFTVIVLVVTVMFMAAVVPKIVEDRPTTTIVGASPGGSIFEFMDKYSTIEVKKEKLVIAGPCMSACTYFLGLVSPERVCATDKSSFWFHGIYRGATGLDKNMVAAMQPVVYPDFVVELLKEKGFDGTKADVDKLKWPIGLIPLTREELRINAC